MAGFSDHFGAVAGTYADCRPHYPDELFSWLAGECAAHALAWDVGCGNGQAAVALAEYIDHVHATDASAGQIAEARAHPRVAYSVATAEHSGLPAASVDLVTIAQALHWFDLPAFYAEVRRVLKPGGLVAAWSYGHCRIEGPAVNAAVDRFYRDVIGSYWPPERRHVETGYRELDFPFASIDTPELELQVDWTLPQLLGYLRSWSATARYQAARGEDPVIALGAQLQPLWGDPARTRTVSWPLAIRAGRMG